MLGLLLLYWIGKYFYKLAESHDKSKWGLAILGIVVYYAGIIISSFIIALFMEFVSPGSVDALNETLFSLLMIPLGILCSYLLYKFLEKRFEEDRLHDGLN
ncbi:hypothetical protein Q2T40_09380 [Winogradskyella maritima]|uniref:Uncharacterized protein n=1 Tax=Winogradskyella maritima TaxID=1517766 RepID=A0ABV8AFE5_9FLAO|nr:hypothetical protein [Winogradskyella maritima]